MTPDDEPAEDRQQRLRTAGAWLRAQREERGWTGSDFARRLNVNQVRVSAYERGQYEIPGNLAELIASTLELPVIEVRRNLGLWIPSETDLHNLQQHTDPVRLTDSALVSELIRRYQRRTDREILEVFPHRSDVPGALWDQIIERTKTDLFLGGYTNYFFWTERPRFSDTLRLKAKAGTRIRILVGDPASEVTHRREQIEHAPLTLSTRLHITLDELSKLGSIPGLEVRLSKVNAEAHVSRSIFRFDNEAIVCEHIAERLGHGSLTFYLRRLHDNGPYDQYTTHLEHLWNGAQPWPPPDK